MEPESILSPMRQPRVVYRRDIEYQHKHANFGTAPRALKGRVFDPETWMLHHAGALALVCLYLHRLDGIA